MPLLALGEAMAVLAGLQNVRFLDFFVVFGGNIGGGAGDFDDLEVAACRDLLTVGETIESVFGGRSELNELRGLV